MADPALYRATPESAWVPVSVRIHEKWSRFGDIPGLDAAQIVDIAPRAVFLVEDIPGGKPLRGAHLSVVEGEGYVLGEADQPDDITVTVAVSRLTAVQSAGFPVPEVA